MYRWQCHSFYCVCSRTLKMYSSVLKVWLIHVIHVSCIMSKLQYRWISQRKMLVYNEWMWVNVAQNLHGLSYVVCSTDIATIFRTRINYSAFIQFKQGELRPVKVAVTYLMLQGNERIFEKKIIAVIFLWKIQLQISVSTSSRKNNNL